MTQTEPSNASVPSGPLVGIRILEMVGLGPGPFASQLLGDLGASVLRVDRGEPGGSSPRSHIDPLNRDRPALMIDLKSAAASDTVLRLVDWADVVIDPFRPGVMTRLGLGPDVCLARKPSLIYASMTGWGTSGAQSTAAGHDINYLALSGALHELRRPGERPLPPLNLLGDYAGGSMYLIAGVLAALLESRTTGKGQVVDVAIVDGVVNLLSEQARMRELGMWDEGNGNMLQDVAPFYEVYRTADDRFLAVGAIEPQFYQAFVEGLGFTVEQLPPQHDRRHWADTRRKFAKVIASQTRDHWVQVYAGVDACTVPVLSSDEAIAHPHLVERGSYSYVAGTPVPAPAPRFSRTPAQLNRPDPDSDFLQETLSDAGFSAPEIIALAARPVAKQSTSGGSFGGR